MAFKERMTLGQVKPARQNEILYLPDLVLTRAASGSGMVCVRCCANFGLLVLRVPIVLNDRVLKLGMSPPRSPSALTESCEPSSLLLGEPAPVPQDQPACAGQVPTCSVEMYGRVPFCSGSVQNVHLLVRRPLMSSVDMYHDRSNSLSFEPQAHALLSPCEITMRITRTCRNPVGSCRLYCWTWPPSFL